MLARAPGILNIEFPFNSLRKSESRTVFSTDLCHAYSPTPHNGTGTRRNQKRMPPLPRARGAAEVSLRAGIESGLGRTGLRPSCQNLVENPRVTFFKNGNLGTWEQGFFPSWHKPYHVNKIFTTGLTFTTDFVIRSLRALPAGGGNLSSEWLPSSPSQREAALEMTQSFTSTREQVGR